MNNRFEMPMMMSAKELQTMGFGRGMAYRLLRGDIVPVVTIGKRRFIRQTTLLDWLDEKERSSGKKAEVSAVAICTERGELYNKDGT
ncbi:MAG: helix-turn-helix domain-containing protein [Oscillospiraceae bacterium]|nr:helix-turn-helix domain-containing protein [Oscillospiraceae bacterium]